MKIGDIVKFVIRPRIAKWHDAVHAMFPIRWDIAERVSLNFPYR